MQSKKIVNIYLSQNNTQIKKRGEHKARNTRNHIIFSKHITKKKKPMITKKNYFDNLKDDEERTKDL